MESLGEEPWDVAICGTGLQQSLLALALSRSDKRILHLDPNDYYGASEAAFSLQEAETWAARHSTASASNFGNASVCKHPEAANRGLSSPRAYSLALAPQIIHTRSNLLAQLVSSRAYRQVEFLAVGSFFVYEPAPSAEAGSGRPQLARIPSSREAVFAARSMFDRSSMRSIMQFLNFAPNYDSEERRPRWEGQANTTFASFLESEFKLDAKFKAYILALTMTLDGQITVKDGLAALHRHLTSFNFFGPGFCAVYPKWGGLSEVAQVGCRAGAVGGSVYMLGTSADEDGSDADKIPLKLSNGVSVQANYMVSSDETARSGPCKISRLVAIVDSKFESLFEVVAEGSPIPAVVPVTFPGGSLPISDDGTDNPVYVMVHSSDTGECPSGQSLLYITTLATSKAHEKLDSALNAILEATASPSEEDQKSASCLYKLYYEQGLNSNREVSVATNAQAGGEMKSIGKVVLPGITPSLAFEDADLDAVKTAYESVTASWGSSPEDDTNNEYMVFDDREGAAAEDYDFE